MKPKKTKREIVEETLAYYEKDPDRRAVDINTGECVYNLPQYTSEGKPTKSKHCAVGRCLLPIYKKQGEYMPGNRDSDVGYLVARFNEDMTDQDTKITLDDLLAPRYRGHGVLFWKQLQLLHDKLEYWSELTEEITEQSKTLRKAKAERILAGKYTDET